MSPKFVDLFGPFPKELLDKGGPELVQRLFDDEGQIKNSAPFGRSPLESDTF
jgi:serine/threonine-protein kinase SRPK3